MIITKCSTEYEVRKAVRELEKSHEHLLRLVTALVLNAGGEIVIPDDVIGEAQLLPDPHIITWVDDNLLFHVKIKKALTS